MCVVCVLCVCGVVCDCVCVYKPVLCVSHIAHDLVAHIYGS